MTRVLIKTSKNKKILEYLKMAVSLYENGTTKLHNLNILKFDRILYILGNMIEITGFPYNNDEKRLMIWQALHKQPFSFDIESFSEILETVIEEWIERKTSEFFLIYPLNIEYETLKDKDHFIVDDFKIDIYSFNNLNNNFDFKDLDSFNKWIYEDWLKKIEVISQKMTYLVVRINAKSIEEAQDIAYRHVEIFRSLLNFLLSFLSFRFLETVPSPLAEVRYQGTFFIFNENRKYIGNEKIPDYIDIDKELIKIEPTKLNWICRNIEHFEKLQKNKLKDLLIDCLLLHNYALDNVGRGYVFLHLWQILELISLKDKTNINFDKVKNRIQSIVNDPVESDVIDALFNKRNKLVHEGKISEFSLGDITCIKMITDICINFLFKKVNELKNIQDLNDFYENIHLDPEKIDEKIKVLSQIKELKIKKT